MTENGSAWAKAFVAAQAEMPEIPKSKKATIQMKGGGQFSYAYADLPAIIAAVSPVLARHGLAVAQSVLFLDGGVGVETVIYHESGHAERFGPLVLPSGDDARSVGSAITYGRRYGLTAALGIAADEDDDAGSAGRRRRDVGDDGQGRADEPRGENSSRTSGSVQPSSPAEPAQPSLDGQDEPKVSDDLWKSMLKASGGKVGPIRTRIEAHGWEWAGRGRLTEAQGRTVLEELEAAS